MGNSASFPVVPIPRDRVMIITGANSGIGYEIAKWCAMMGATVILACRSEDKTRTAMAQMNRDFDSEKARGTEGICTAPELAIEYAHLDLSSFKSVLKFCEEFKQSGRKLHVLFCNAGLGLGPYEKTEDGLETMLQVNYLSHFIVIGKLLPVMKNSGPDCRILLMASAAHRVGTFDMKTFNYTGSPDSFETMNYYGRSKLYQIMQAITMARRFSGPNGAKNITINSMHPGLVETRFARDARGCWKCLMGCGKCFSRTPLDGATCGIDLAVNSKYVGVSGLYWMDCENTSPNGIARDAEKQEQLWTETLNLIGQHLTPEEIDGIEGRS